MDIKGTRLKRLLGHEGKTLILPYDQGLEHGPKDFFSSPESADPRHIIEIAEKAGYDAVVMHVGNAKRYFGEMYGKVPLILKVNGKTNIPSEDEPLSPITASIDDALQLSAIAIGYTLYVGSPRQAEDFEQFAMIREEADRYGLPVIVWSYPRGKYINEKGGKDSLYAVEYAARVAAELGADMIKLNVPDIKKAEGVPEPYRGLEIGLDGATKRVIAAASGVPIIFAGGAMVSEEDLLYKAKICIKSGASGLIFGRNIWQRSVDEAVNITEKIKGIIKGYNG